MADPVVITRHGTSTPTTGDLADFQLGFDSAAGILYIRNGASVVAIGASTFIPYTGASASVDLGANGLTANTISIADANTYLAKDGSNNMTFTDAVTGTRTLKNIGCPVYLFIKATAQSEGDLHLSDGTNWNVNKALIKTLRIVTSSTDWDLYILQNDNGFATDDANIPMMQIGFNENGNADILLDHPYSDEDASGEVHLYFLDNSGSNTADIYVIGTELI